MMEWSGSPTKKPSSYFTIRDENDLSQLRTRTKASNNSSNTTLPLTTSNLVNQLRSGPSVPGSAKEMQPDELLARLNRQQKLIRHQQEENQAIDRGSNSSSMTDPYANTPPAADTSDHRPDAAEVLQLKKQLEMAQERMAQLDLALTQSRLAPHTMEEAMGTPFPRAQHLAANIPTQYGPQPNLNGMQQNAFSSGSSSLDHDVNRKLPLRLHTAETYPSCTRPSSSFSTRPMTPLNLQAPTLPSLNTAPYTLQPPVGTRLSPTAVEFSGNRAWGKQSMHPPPTPFMAPGEPINYRQLLDRNMTCNWKYIVDKIVCNNDQQASIFMQQKLKVGTPEQKFEIVQAIIEQAYPLMVNRFGNFLVQRCFEHGTPEQVVSIAQAIRGNTLNLSMDAFGCHVVQKAFDCVPEEYKAVMVHELLRRIPETVIHRYACHVWQKLFELRWCDSPPQIMKYVNESLRGMWHEVALGETGSLVVQNIFENCLEEDKRPCINEVLASIDVVAHGQFGNWCIQHICEHGSAQDQNRAIDHVIRFAPEYSMDQYASKVVEKCLKTNTNNDFLDRYLDRVCEARIDRPRMPLIDISGDQYGNYLIQYILTNADAARREIVAAHIRKHMVSLRGSKYGSRVALLCCNPTFAARPGPPAVPPPRNTTTYGMDRFGGFPGDRLYMGRGGHGGGYR